MSIGVISQELAVVWFAVCISCTPSWQRFALYSLWPLCRDPAEPGWSRRARVSPRPSLAEQRAIPGSQAVSPQQIVRLLLDREPAEDEAVVRHSAGRRRAVLAQTPLCPSGIVHCLFCINPG